MVGVIADRSTQRVRLRINSIRSILHASIGVVNQTGRRLALDQRHAQCRPQREVRDDFEKPSMISGMPAETGPEGMAA
jgi:hypothetical protein